MSKKTYLENTEKLIKGDNAKDISVKNQKIMSATITAQISLKTAERVRLEQKVEDAREAVEVSLLSKEVIGDADSTLERFLQTKQALEKAEKELQNHDKTVEWLQEGSNIVG